MSDRQKMMMKVVSTHIVLPMAMTIGSYLGPAHQLILNTIAQTVIAILYFAGYWEFFGLRVRIVWCALIETLLLFQLWFIRPVIYFDLPNSYVGSVLIIVQSYLLFVFMKILIVRFYKEKNSVDIGLPLKDGMFLITDGGNSKISRMMNYHYHSAIHKQKKTNASMMFAIDIIKLKKNRYDSFFPKRNEEYPIFGENVYAPIDGEIVKIENTIPDNLPYCGNYPYNAGNIAVIKNGDLYLLLGHLLQGSITLTEGNRVTMGDLIARAGNSGMSERPHIHMQLMESKTNNYWSGRGINIVFDGNTVFKNRVINK